MITSKTAGSPALFVRCRDSKINTSSYVGRFAPSPSGSLHFGSLIAALGSYLRARAQNGLWKLRIEDIDPPREVAGASDDIIRTLEAFGFEWDGEIVYQSQRIDAYQSYLDMLLNNNKAYFCQCSRKQIKAMGGTYNGHCGQIQTGLSSGAIRIRNNVAVNAFTDKVMGKIKTDQHFAAEDFIIKRSDGLYAYQLAVVLDDAYQQVTEVVRGCDLLEATVRQVSLYQLFNLPSPNWLHLPLACVNQGFKLSKQNHATAIDSAKPQIALKAALAFLGQTDIAYDDVHTMLAQAIAEFDYNKIPKLHEQLINTNGDN